MSRDPESKYEKSRRNGGLSAFLLNNPLLLVLACLLSLVVYYMANKHEVPIPRFGTLTEPNHFAKTAGGSLVQQQQQHNVKDEPSMEQLFANVRKFDQNVRELRKGIAIFETDPEGMAAAKELQDATRELLHRLYGKAEPYRIHVILQFQDTISDFDTNGPHGDFVIELAPSSLQPHSIFTFLELCRHWKSGAFHRIAHHVLQVMVKSQPVLPHLAFQEYSPDYPHKQRTVGYAGRPSGPAWYVSIQDNSRNHGPGSQQKANPHEADSCFGTVVEGYDEHVKRISKVQGDGFLGDAKKHVLIKEMIIMVPDSDGTYVKWKDDYKGLSVAGKKK